MDVGKDVTIITILTIFMGMLLDMIILPMFILALLRLDLPRRRPFPHGQAVLMVFIIG
ncbi:MAG: hypothetical protein Tsb009_07140 [Planctomycetaceae bacterium]